MSKILSETMKTIESLDASQLADLCYSLTSGIVEDDSHYVITNGPAFLTQFCLEGRGYRFEFGCEGAILFDNESEAQMILALLCGLTAFDFDLDRSDWMVSKSVPVKPVFKGCMSRESEI